MVYCADDSLKTLIKEQVLGRHRVKIKILLAGFYLCKYFQNRSRIIRAIMD